MAIFILPLGQSEDLSGQSFGKLKVVGYVGKDAFGDSFWQCHCDCGRVAPAVAGNNLKSGRTGSCGCEQHGNRGKAKEYTAWNAIRARCCNPNSIQYADYGGRGVLMCDRWKESFESFLADMGPKPGPGYSIDRFPDNNGNYEPGNCRWATRTEQNRNKRNNRMLTFNGVTKSMAQWAEETGISYFVLRSRKQRGWSDEDALTCPLRSP